MTGPLWLHAALASLMIVIAVGCAIRLGLVRCRLVNFRLVGFGVKGAPPARRDADGLHVLMGVAMAGMLLPQLRFLPVTAWESVFGLGVIWFGWRAFTGRRVGGAPFAHVIECLAMMFMLLPAVGDVVGRSHPFGQAMAGMSGTSLISVAPAVALLLALCLVGCVVWTADALARTRAGGPVARPATGAAAGPADGAATGPAVAVAGGALAPRLAAFSAIAMTLTMGYMLIQMA